MAKEKKTTRSLLRDTARLTSSLDGFLNAQTMSLQAILTNVAAVLEVMSDAERRFEVSLGALPSVLENGANAIKGNATQMEAVLGIQIAERSVENTSEHQY